MKIAKFNTFNVSNKITKAISFQLINLYISDALRDLVPFVQFKKCEKHPWKSVNFSKVAG